MSAKLLAAVEGRCRSVATRARQINVQDLRSIYRVSEEGSRFVKITAIAPWFGSNRMLAKHVADQLRGCRWVGIPFAGGMSELSAIDATAIVVSDLHRAVINLAEMMGNQRTGPKLYRQLRRMPFHPNTLLEARRICEQFEAKPPEIFYDQLSWACAYFVAVWMNRSALAGTDSEFRGGLPVRWSATGGDSAVRFHHAVLGIPEWRRVLRRCNFVCLDCFEFLGTCKDELGHGIYCDPPFPDAGAKYKFKFAEQDHANLATSLLTFDKARIVCRFYDHPLIRDLYKTSDGWRWNVIEGGRKQSNSDAPEVLITRNER